MKQKLLSRYQNIASKLGLTFNLVEDLNFPLYDNNICQIGWSAINNSEIAKTEMYLAHELAHYIVATPEEKTLPNYGLGHIDDNIPVLTTRNICQIEREAFLLGLVIVRSVGFLNDYYLNIQFKANKYGFSETKETYKRLIKKNFITSSKNKFSFIIPS